MIGYLEGTLLEKGEDRILLLAGRIGYEVLLPVFVADSLGEKQKGDPLSFFIYHQQTERQPKPVLIGFNTAREKAFFQLFVSVEDIGVLKAAKAMNMKVQNIADAIEARDFRTLEQMKGIGKRTAQKIVAALEGKVAGFLSPDLKTMESKPEAVTLSRKLTEPVTAVLVERLGHKPSEARKLIEMAMAKNSAIDTPEALFEEIYRQKKENR